jgi:hypothetical protein
MIWRAFSEVLFVMAHAEHRDVGGLGRLRAHSGGKQVADVTVATRMLDGNPDHFAPQPCRALGRPRVIRKMKRR